MIHKLIPILLTLIVGIVLVFFISLLIKKRKRAGVTGIKSALTSIFSILIAVTNLLAYWFNFIGVLSWSITVILLMLGAYFTKYMPVSEK